MERFGEWSFRGYLPHYSAASTIQAITFRLADSLPRSVQAKLGELSLDSFDLRRKIEKYLDAGHGRSLLSQFDHATTVSQALSYFHGDRYALHAWVIMPNHVHVLIELLSSFSVGQIVQSWKGFTGRRIARHEPAFMAEHGRIWQVDYFDRYIRNERHYRNVVEYIHDNPVKAGLVATSEQWLWSSRRA
ncbi:MAG TPA: transposase [Opitutaceae bacterium]